MTNNPLQRIQRDTVPQLKARATFIGGDWVAPAGGEWLSKPDAGDRPAAMWSASGKKTHRFSVDAARRRKTKVGAVVQDVPLSCLGYTPVG